MDGIQGLPPLAEVQEAEPPGGFQGGALTLHRAHRPSASIVAFPTVNPSRSAASRSACASSWSSSSVTFPQLRQIRNCAA